MIKALALLSLCLSACVEEHGSEPAKPPAHLQLTKNGYAEPDEFYDAEHGVRCYVWGHGISCVVVEVRRVP